MTRLNISDFFNEDYVDYASYDNLRKIASVVDGQKNASRKVLHTVLQQNIKAEVKLSTLAAKVSEFTEYLHGAIDGVIVSLAQNYAGTNNIPLLVREGNFGTRHENSASASRYIFTHGSNEFFELFNKEDSKVLTKQYFEGAEIEPVHFVPSLPLLLINGSEGVSSGFAQIVLPRNPKNIKKYITQFCQGKPPSKELLTPYYCGFKGEIVQGDNPAQWLIKGKVEKLSSNRILITEVPIGYDLQGYLKVLNKLEDEKKITSYKDMSENDEFLFEIRMPSKDISKLDNDGLLNHLKLIKKVTENYTVMSENNTILVMENAEEIIQHYIKVKMKYLELRKENVLKDLCSAISLDFSKYLFIKNIVDDKLVINKRKKSQIEKELESIENIIKHNDSYDYLLNMSIQSLTEERMERLKSDIEEQKKIHDNLLKSTLEEIWLSEVNNKFQNT